MNTIDIPEGEDTKVFFRVVHTLVTSEQIISVQEGDFYRGPRFYKIYCIYRFKIIFRQNCS